MSNRAANGLFMTSRAFTDEQVIAMVDNGKTTTQIVDEFDSSSETILKIIHKHNRQPNLPPKFWNDRNRQHLRDLWVAVPKLTTTEMGRQLGANKNMVIGEAGRMGLPQRGSATSRRERPEIRERAVALLKNGLPPAQVALMVGIKRKTAQGMRKGLNLPPLETRCNRTHRRTRPAVPRVKQDNPHMSRLPMPPRPVAVMDLFQTVAVIPSVRVPRDADAPQCQFRAGHSGDWRQCDNPASAFRDDGSMAPEGRVWCLECRRRVYRAPGTYVRDEPLDRVGVAA